MKLSDLLVPSTKFSKFRCDTYKKFSANPGILYPVWFNLLNPGESASIDLRTVIRTWPTESPLMASIKVRFATVAFNLKNYSIALEGYKRSFDWLSTQMPFIRYKFNPDYNYSFDFNSTDNDGSSILKPITTLSYLASVHDCSIFDYLGYPSGWMPDRTTTSVLESEGVLRTSKSFLPFLCYYDFYRNYLINPQESQFPLFFARNNVAQLRDTSANLKYVLKPETYVKMIDVSCIDNLISDVHKYYDGSLNLSSVKSASPGNVFFDYFKTDFYPGEISVTPGSIGNICSVPHGGLVATTFDPDINTMWLSVDNYSRLDDVKVNTQSVSGSYFTNFVDIVKASSVWDFMNRMINSDGTYGDFINNQFGVSVKGDLNIPQIVHVYDTLLTFDDVTSQADTASADGAVVGQQFGVGRSFGQSNSFRVVNKDGNYVMLMTFMWATPQVCYKDGLHHLHNIIDFSDLYQPSFDNYAMQPRLQEQVNGVQPATLFNSNPTDFTFTDVSTSPFLVSSYGRFPVLAGVDYSVFFSPQDVPLGYQPAWSDYKTDVDVVHGMFRHELDYYTILRSVPRINSLNSVPSAYTYYVSDVVYAPEVDAQQFQIPFAIDAEDCMQVQLRVGATFTRAMSKNINPNVK